MNDLMAAMFWGGLVMAVTPVAVGVYFMVYMYRRHQEDRSEAEVPAGSVPPGARAVNAARTEGERIAPAADE